MNVLGPVEIARLCHAQGWRGTNLPTAVAVFLGESEGDADAFNGVGGDMSYGLAQINMRGPLGPERRTRYGLSRNEDLYDPATNIRVAYDIWVRAGHSFSPWGAYTSGGYRKYGRYERAKEAVAAMSSGLHYDRANVPPYSGGPRPGALKLRDLMKQKWPVINFGYPFGIYAAREGEHGDGRAIDGGLNASSPSHRVIAERVCEWAVENAAHFGIQSVIWNRRVWGFGNWYWRDYHGPSPHTDHVHIGLNLYGASGDWEEEDDLPYTPEQLKELIREVLDEDPRTAGKTGFRHLVWKALFKKNATGDYEEHLNVIERKLTPTPTAPDGGDAG